MMIIVIIDHDHCNRTNATVDFRFLAKSISLALLACLSTMAEHSFEQNLILISYSLMIKEHESLLLLVLWRVEQILQVSTFGLSLIINY